MPRYNDEQKSLALAAVERYGHTTALRVLDQLWPDGVPSRQTLYTWQSEGIEIAQGDTDYLTKLDSERKQRWQAGIDGLRDSLFDAFETAIEDRNYLGMQQSATAVGIMYDKLVPPVRAGMSMSLPGDNPHVTLVVTAPTSTGEPRPIPDERVIDVEAT